MRILSSLPDQAPPPIPPMPASPTPLILHFDINETILIGDDAGGDTRDESLNKILAKSAFVRIPEIDDHAATTNADASSPSVIPTCWWDGTELNRQENGGGTVSSAAPDLYTGWTWPSGCMPYYRTAYKKLAKSFIHGHGRPYKPMYDEMKRILSLEDDSSLTSESTSVMSHMVPAIFHTLKVLTERSEPFQLVLRSFGSDVYQVAEAISMFAQGKHPDYVNFRNDNLVTASADVVKGRWSVSNNGAMSFQLWKDGAVVASGDEQVLEWIQQRTICGIEDDYAFWSRNQCQPWAGKPVWVPARKCNQHHLLFDDNIHNLSNDSIASVRMQSSPGAPFRSLSGEDIQRMQGVHLIRVPTIEPIFHPDWFLQQMDKARARYAAADRS